MKCRMCDNEAVYDKYNHCACQKHLDGTFNDSADRVRRIEEVWSDGNLDDNFDESPSDYTFSQLVCRNCEGKVFEVLETDHYETSARCVSCGMYYIVHSG